MTTITYIKLSIHTYWKPPKSIIKFWKEWKTLSFPGKFCLAKFWTLFSSSKTLLFGRNQALKPCSIDGAWKIMQNALVKVSNGFLGPELWHVYNCPSDRPSIQSRARPTDSPSRLTETQNKYCVGCYDIYSIHSHYKGNHKRGAAAEGRGTTFVMAMNRLDALDLVVDAKLHFPCRIYIYTRMYVYAYIRVYT